MKILYGVQGTGNGHISRARMMARHFRRRGVDVTFLFSGRPPAQYFDMEIFGDYQVRTGLTFATRNGAINYWKSLFVNRPLRFVRELKELDVSPYDVILTDFEPTVAWAGRLARERVIGLGHQYAFREPLVPNQGVTFASSLVMRYFAPADLPLGLHWAPFGGPILPPIVDPEETRANGDQVLVYLPFENQADVTRVLRQLDRWRFVQYAPQLNDGENGNVSLRRTSLKGFRRDLGRSSAVVCNTGFELISECLNVGLPVLTRPVTGQGEQQANAEALKRLGYARILENLDAAKIGEWLSRCAEREPLGFPDVAESVVEWLCDGCRESVQDLSDRLWNRAGAPAAGRCNSIVI